MKSAIPTSALPIYFLHVPKSAGVSVFELLRKNFSPQEICPKPPAGTWSASASEVPGYSLYAGHFSIDFIEEMGLRGTRLIMLRDPLARVISLYDYWRSHTWEYIRSTLPEPPAYNGPALAKSRSLGEFLVENARYFPNPVENAAAQQLLGSKYSSLWPNQDALIQTAIETLHAFDWVGIADQFDSSLHRLRKLLHLPRSASPQANATYTIPGDGTREAVTKSRPTADERRRILEGNRIDQAIYEEARKVLERVGV